MFVKIDILYAENGIIHKCRDRSHLIKIQSYLFTQTFYITEAMINPWNLTTQGTIVHVGTAD